MNLKKLLLNWLARRLPACKEITRMASDSMERKLSLRQRIDFKLHLLICSLCMRYVKQLQLMHGLAHQHTTKSASGVVTSSLAPDARERMKQALRA